MIKILFICHGNICRSPLAEFYFKDLVAKHNLSAEFYIESAATSYEETGNPVHPGTRKKLAVAGISCAGKTARCMEREDYRKFDYLIGMDQANIRLKEAAGGEVTVLSIGDESVKNSLKNCLAVGADYAYLAANDAYQSADPEIIAKELKAAKEAIEEKTGKKFDIVFCGKETTDFASGQVGTILAKELSAPVTADVVDITAGEGKVTVKQETEEGYCMIESGLPCVVAVNKPEYDPRYPTIKSKMAARKKPIEELAAEEAGAAQVEVLRVYAPAKRAAGVKIKAEDPAEVVSQALAMMSEAKAI